MGNRTGRLIPTKLYLEEWRRYRGLSGDQLAERFGVTGPTITKWESGQNKPNYEQLAGLAKILGTWIGGLFLPPYDQSADAMLGNLPEAERKRMMRMISAATEK
jgi:transcriptional regulator with XRE-family HTH domain